MSRSIRNAERWESRGYIDRSTSAEWTYPTGMVWCPMKKSGMAIMKCAALQKFLGCGSRAQLRTVSLVKPGAVPFLWPWLIRGRECPERAGDEELRELRLALSPLKPVEESRKNPRAYRCPSCGGNKVFGARRCRRCWRVFVRR